jgi:hypothetical protein
MAPLAGLGHGQSIMEVPAGPGPGQLPLQAVIGAYRVKPARCEVQGDAMTDAAPSTAHDPACSDQQPVNAALTPKRRRPVVENSDYAAFSRRVLRAYSRRVAEGDIESLALMAGLAGDIDAAIGQAVGGLRSAGYSWADIGARLGISRQAAQQRWDHPGRDHR